jgi:hypothetical protein
LRVVGGAPEMPAKAGEQPTCSNCSKEGGQPAPDWVEVALLQAMAGWRERRNERALREALGRLFAAV